MQVFNLIPGQVSLAELRGIYEKPARLSLVASAAAQIEASVACVERILAEDRTAYGINTGFMWLYAHHLSMPHPPPII